MRAKKCIFLGFQRGAKDFVLFDLNSKEIFLYRHITFHEKLFPFHQLSHTHFDHTTHPTLVPTNSVQAWDWFCSQSMHTLHHLDSIPTYTISPSPTPLSLHLVDTSDTSLPQPEALMEPKIDIPHPNSSLPQNSELPTTGTTRS